MLQVRKQPRFDYGGSPWSFAHLIAFVVTLIALIANAPVTIANPQQQEGVPATTESADGQAEQGDAAADPPQNENTNDENTNDRDAAEIDESAPQAPTSPASSEDDPPVNDDEADGTPDTQPKPLREQTIYIPYSKIRGIFEKEGRGVFIPYEQFQVLWKQARSAIAEPPTEPLPPVSSLIAEIESEATVENEVVRITSKMQIELLGDRWHEVPLRLGDAAILSAEIDQRAARIVPGDNGYKLLVLKKPDAPSRITLNLVYAKAFTKSPGRNSVSFQAPQAPVNQWRIRIPQSGVKINVHPMLAATEQPADAEKTGNAAQETVVLAFVGAANEVRIDWTPRSEGASGMAALATAESQQQFYVEEGIVRASTRLYYKISRAELTELQIDVPLQYKVTNVLDANVRGWNVQVEGDRQRINVQLFEPAKSSQTVLVELEQFSQQGATAAELEAPVVQAIGVGRQHGFVAVRLAEGLRGEAIERTGLLQLDADELPPELARGRWDFAYQFSSLPTSLRLSLQKVEPRVQATQVVEAFLEPEQITLYLIASFTIERAGVFQFAFDVPTDYEIRSMQGIEVPDGKPAVYDSRNFSADQPGRLVMNLGAKAIGKVGVFLELQKRLDDPNLLTPTGQASDLDIPLPRVAADTVEHVDGHLIVYSPESLRANPKIEGLQAISLREAMSSLPSPRGDRFATLRPILSYAHSQQPASLVLATQRRKPQITARQLLETTLEAGAVKYRTRFLYDILYSGVKSLRIDLPLSLVADITNETKSIQDVRLDPQPEDVPEGYEAWSFTGETELLGRHEIVLTWEEKLTGLGVGQSKDVTIPWLRPADVDRQWGQIVIGKGDTLDVRPKGELTGLRPIDPQTDLIENIRVDRAARAFEFHDEWSLVITATRYELEDVKHTSIERAVLRMVVGADEQTSVQALYRMRSARQRLQVKLPAAFDPGRGFNQNPLRINGRAMPLERGDAGEYYIPLAEQAPDTPFVLELRYSLASDQRLLAYPEFPNEPAIQKVYLCVYLPKDQAIVGSAGPWENDLAEMWQRQLTGFAYERPRDDRLVNWVTEDIALISQPMSDFQTQGTMYTFSTVRPPAPDTGALRIRSITKDALDAIIFLLITIPGVVLVTQPIGRRLVAVGLVLFGLVFSGVFLPSLSLHLFDSALFLAIFLVGAVWVLMGMLRIMRSAAALAFDRSGGGGAPPETPIGPGSPTPPSPIGSGPNRPKSPGDSGKPSGSNPPAGPDTPSPITASLVVTSDGTAVTPSEVAARSASEPGSKTGIYSTGGLFSWGNTPLEGPSYHGPPVAPLPASYYRLSSQAEDAEKQQAEQGLFDPDGLFGWSGRRQGGSSHA